ncbi:MAG: carbohydrate kinase family protein [Candidatus Limisoma sp.]
MKKVIAIGQSVLDIIHLDGRPTASFTGGRIANMAASLGRCGISVEYVSECATDSVGDMVVDFLKRNSVGTASVDRFTEGQSQVSLIFRTSDGAERYSEYVNYPSSRFDVLWPRIDEGDIVVFGSYFAIDDNPRRGLLELLNYAQQRKAIIVYLPDFSRNYARESLALCRLSSKTSNSPTSSSHANPTWKKSSAKAIQRKSTKTTSSSTAPTSSSWTATTASTYTPRAETSRQHFPLPKTTDSAKTHPSQQASSTGYSKKMFYSAASTASAPTLGSESSTPLPISPPTQSAPAKTS